MTQTPQIPPTKRSSDEIASDMDQTRSAIASELKELGTKLSTEHLREGAKQVLSDAREEARGALREAKDAAIDTLRTARDNAFDSVSETVHEATERARRMGVRTASFVGENAVPLTLLGIGAGWLMLSLRNRRTYRAADDFSYDSYDRERPYDRESYYGRERHEESAVQHAWSASRREAARLGDQVRQGTQRARETVSAAAHDVSERAGELAHGAREGLMRGGEATREFARENPMALGALALAGGVGLGLLLPHSEVEDRMLGTTRDQLFDEARRTAQAATRGARETAQELGHTLTK